MGDASGVINDHNYEGENEGKLENGAVLSHEKTLGTISDRIRKHSHFFGAGVLFYDPHENN